MAPGYASGNDVVYGITTLRQVYMPTINKIGTVMQGAGTPFSMYQRLGFPGAGAAPAGTPGAVCTNLAGSINFPDTANNFWKFLLSYSMMATQQCTVILYDRLWHVSGISLASTGNKTVSSGTLTRYGGAAASTINGATNASPIVVACSGAHGFLTGMIVTISGVVGNTAANGTWQITVTDSTHYSLNGSTGNGAWSSGGTQIQSAAGVEAWLEITTATTVTAPVVAMNSYTNQDGSTGRAGGNLTFPAAATVLDAMIGPLPMQSGDTGVQACSTINVVTAGSAGAANFVLLRKLAEFPLVANLGNIVAEITKALGMPQVYDGASIFAMVIPNATTALNLYGHMVVGYR